MNVKMCDMCGNVIQKTYFQADMYAEVKTLKHAKPANYDFCESCSRKVIDVIENLISTQKGGKNDSRNQL